MDDAVRHDIARVFALQQEHKWVQKTRSVEHRIDMLRRLRTGTLEYADRLEVALKADMAKPSYEPYMQEVVNVLHPIDDAIQHLAEWAATVEVDPSLEVEGMRAQMRYEARGVCIVFGPWNFPFQLLIEPLVPVIAAGNTAILKPNEVTPATSAVTAELIRSIFDEREVAIFEGGVDVSNALLELPVDHIFFTGSPAVGKVIMTAAAKQLASVTLELGGKCPAVVGPGVDVAEVAGIVAAGRHDNGGQLCLSTDYVFVHESIRDEFLRHYDRWIDEHLYTNGALNPLAMSHIVDERNMGRVLSYLDDARQRGARITRGGTRSTAVADMIEPTVVLDPPFDSKLMTEEIFGPVLPVQTFEDVREVIKFVRQGTKPLAMYLFSPDPAFVEALLDGTSSGGVTINGWGTHWGESRLPFGGVNHSGIGRYHGIHGFRELSHERSVVWQPADR